MMGDCDPCIGIHIPTAFPVGVDHKHIYIAKFALYSRDVVFPHTKYLLASTLYYLHLPLSLSHTLSHSTGTKAKDQGAT